MQETINFGKHRGLPIEEVPISYLKWATSQENIPQFNILKNELDKRIEEEKRVKNLLKRNCYCGCRPYMKKENDDYYLFCGDENCVNQIEYSKDKDEAILKWNNSHLEASIYDPENENIYRYIPIPDWAIGGMDSPG